jgi:rhamnogalacturonyl hydrolase YesR
MNYQNANNPTEHSSGSYSNHKCGSRFWRTLFIAFFCVTALVAAYEARLFDRIATRWEMPAGTLDGKFNDQNLNLLLKQTVADLNHLKPMNRTETSDYGPIEKIFREGFEKRKLNPAHALLAIGIAVSQPATNSPAFVALDKYCTRNVDSTGTLVPGLRVIDDFSAGEVFLEMYQRTGKDFYRVGAQKMARWLMNYPTNKLGALSYRAEHPDVLMVDDKGMICGFLIRYGAEFGDAGSLNLGVRQLRVFLQHGLNDSGGLPYHAYDLALDRKFGPDTWLRGAGWLAMGLADALTYLPRDHEARTEFAAALTKMLETLRTYQEPDGCWRWDVNNPVAELDTSGTAMIGYAVEKAVQAGAINSSWQTLSENALRGVLRHTHPNGLVDQALVECNGVGHYAKSFKPSNYAQGPTLALFSLVQQRNAKTNQIAH